MKDEDKVWQMIESTKSRIGSFIKDLSKKDYDERKGIHNLNHIEKELEKLSKNIKSSTLSFENILRDLKRILNHLNLINAIDLKADNTLLVLLKQNLDFLRDSLHKLKVKAEKNNIHFSDTKFYKEIREPILELHDSIAHQIKVVKGIETLERELPNLHTLEDCFLFVNNLIEQLHFEEKADKKADRLTLINEKIAEDLDKNVIKFEEVFNQQRRKYDKAA